MHKQTYLDNAATTPLAPGVLEAMQKYYENKANIHRGLYQSSEEATQKFEDARKNIANYIGAKSKEIIFTSGATSALNIIAKSVSQLNNRKKIVVSILEHHANFLPWLALRKEGFEIEFIDLLGFDLDYKDAAKKIDKNTCAVVFTHTSNVLGTRVDCKKLIELAKKNGALSVMDATQGIVHSKISLQDLPVDFLAFSSHKMYGPTGVGVLYGKEIHLEKMDPFFVGGDMVLEASKKGATWNALPYKFEAGTPPIAEVIGLGVAVDFLKENIEEIERKEKELTKYLLESLKKIKGITLLYGKGAGIVSFTLKDIHAHDVVAILAEENICLRGGHHCAMPLMEELGINGTIRASTSYFTTKKDIDALILGLQKVCEVFYA